MLLRCKSRSARLVCKHRSTFIITRMKPFISLKGEVTVTCGEQVWRATDGSFAFLPKRVAHTFKVEGSTPARMLVITSPGGPFGFEYFVKEVGDPAPTLTIPPARPPDEQRLRTLAEKYSIELLFPF
jgi:Cupin domain